MTTLMAANMSAACCHHQVDIIDFSILTARQLLLKSTDVGIDYDGDIAPRDVITRQKKTQILSKGLFTKIRVK